MSFVYDAAGNRSQRTDYNNAVTNYTSDALNRLTNISYPDLTAATYGYDELSRLTTATNPNGTVTIAYDNRSRVSSVTDVFGQVVSYAYDANGNRTQLSLNGGTSATYQYDVINRLTQLTDNASLNTTFAYDLTNKLTARSLPNGVATSYQYDGLNRLTRLTHSKAGNTLADFQYQFNAVGNITQMTDGADVNNYTYDPLDRLTAATHPNQTNESYTYDDVGNRTASHQGSSYTYQTFNRLVAANGASFGYDANGNLTSKTDASGSWTYTWDYENRMKQASKAGGVTVSYSYDALGRRIQRTRTSGGTTKFVYDGADVMRDLDGNGVTVADYLNGPDIDNKLRQTASGTASYLVTDHLGTTRGLTDASGNLATSIGYDSFGNSGGSASTRYTYTGRELDADTGLYYYRARWYDPQVGRFISEDPIGFSDDMNWYSYVANDSVNGNDPSGLSRGRGPGHSVSLKKDPWEWLKRFKGRRERNLGDSEGHDEQLKTRCRELEKWLLALTMVSLSEAELHRELMNQYDWCKRRFPNTCKDPSLIPNKSSEPSSVPSPTSNKYSSWLMDGILRWDDGTPIDPVKYPGAYKRTGGQFYVFPINPLTPGFMPGTVPIRVPIFVP